ncbi:hypothetical protein RU89_GL001229 [Lactococcus cremoris]|nr:hypothetical protein AB995_2542 [Lactococcus cremoris]KZK32984.1 hypothetical protein LMG6897_2513 [Lactococcus cremoris]KZK45340.1 hypothetical protein FG2_1726 [Lactococcus cremoris]PCS15214.1 hypothetical protein RU89_GL001229 [Lactococcus cremoris]
MMLPFFDDILSLIIPHSASPYLKIMTFWMTSFFYVPKCLAKTSSIHPEIKK